MGGKIDKTRDAISLGGECASLEVTDDLYAGLLIGYDTKGRCLYRELLKGTNEEDTGKL